MKIIFATNNAHKLSEVLSVLGPDYELVTPRQCGIEEDIPETQPSIEGNALQKAHYLHDRTGLDCFADDTGLEVGALNGAPGVHSARYATPHHDAQSNSELLLANMENEDNRAAQFRTIIALIIDGKELLFEGVIKGVITTEPYGNQGFGYDPLFIPDGYTQTFAQMGAQIKNRISHRAIAVRKLADYLHSIEK